MKAPVRLTESSLRHYRGCETINRSCSSLGEPSRSSLLLRRPIYEVLVIRKEGSKSLECLAENSMGNLMLETELENHML